VRLAKTVLSRILGLSLLCLTSSFAIADQPRVGRDAAAKYFKEDATDDREIDQGRSGDIEHYLALQIGSYMGSTSYEWNGGSRKNVGGATGGVTYRVSEWNNQIDWNIRLDFQEFDVGGAEKPLKFSILPLLTFPNVNSKFPLYFGFGAGPGIFFKQVSGGSSLALDYQLVAGARFFDVAGNAGFFIESGLKNHLHLLTSGQLNGTFLAGGALFTF
jgi:hypothetical protein